MNFLRIFLIRVRHMRICFISVAYLRKLGQYKAYASNALWPKGLTQAPYFNYFFPYERIF